MISFEYVEECPYEEMVSCPEGSASSFEWVAGQEL